jgi:hypothetical protein
MLRRLALGAMILSIAGGSGCDCGRSGGAGDGGTDMPNDGLSDLFGDQPIPDLFIPDGPGIPLPDGGMCYFASCARGVWACGDCMDNDGDGLIDDDDPDCLGPCHNSENSFYLNIPGSETPNCDRDCYYDNNQGSGNDHCAWASTCDPLAPEIGCEYDVGDVGSIKCPDVQRTGCQDFCGPLTPNGCDCFGCCYIEFATMSATVFLGTRDSTGTPTCALDNPDGCAPCTQAQNCVNTCEDCELCLGRDPSDIPASCADMGVRMCPFAPNQPCGLPGDPDCAPGYRCVTGCCAAIIL